MQHMAIANTMTVRKNFMSVAPLLCSTAGEYKVTGTWLPYLYQGMKLDDFLISTYIRQPNVKVTVLKRPSNIWPSCSRCYSFEWVWHNVKLVITDTEMYCGDAKVYINVRTFFFKYNLFPMSKSSHTTLTTALTVNVFLLSRGCPITACTRLALIFRFVPWRR